MLEDRDLEKEFELTLRAMRAVSEDDLRNRVNSLFLELTGNIVTQCE